MIGIYKITSPSKKVYIGQSKDIERRKRNYANLNCKGQVKLYNSIKKYGWERHIFEIICECSIDELNDKERYYQDLYSVSGSKGLNLKLTNTKVLKSTISESTKIKISTSNRIVNAKKRGDYDPNKDYSIYESKKTKSKKLFFRVNGKTYKSIKEVYDNNKEYFHSYSSLAYNIRKCKYFTLVTYV